VLVFSNYNAVLHQAKHAFQQNGISSIIFTGELDQQERQRALNAFKKNDQLSAILMNAKVGAEGLTLTEANNVIFLNEWWNPSSNRQAEDRVNRIGQSQNIIVHVIRALKTIDIEIAKVIDGKQNLEQTFMEELTNRITA
jgi:SNF2 family DNA or RNA helicase